MPTPDAFEEKIDYYLDEDGLIVLTEFFLKKRGYCCQSGCRHCPYGYSKNINPEIPSEWQDAWGKEGELSVYEGPLPDEE